MRVPPGVASVIWVGMECTPSATTSRVRWSKVTGPTQLVADRGAHLVAQRGHPCRGGAAVHRGLGARGQVPGQPTRRAGVGDGGSAGLRVRRRGDAQQLVDLRVTVERGDAGVAADGEGAGRGKREHSCHGGLRVAAGRGDLGADAAEQDVELVGERRRPGGTEQIGGEPQGLGGRGHPGDGDLGEPDAALPEVVLQHADVGGVHRDLDGREPPCGECHDLARLGQRRWTQRRVDRGAAVEGEVDVGDGARPLGLEQRQMVGRHRVGELDLDRLVGPWTEDTFGPGGLGVAIDGGQGLLLGDVGDRVAVGRGPHRGHAADLGHGLGVAPRAGEDGHRDLRGVGNQWRLVGLLDVAVVVENGAPGQILLLIGVGEDQHGALLHLRVESRPIVGVGARVQHRGVAGEQPSSGRLHESLPVSGHQQGFTRALGAARSTGLRALRTPPPVEVSRLRSGWPAGSRRSGENGWVRRWSAFRT